MRTILFILGIFLCNYSFASSDKFVIEKLPVKNGYDAIVTVISDDGDFDSGQILNNLAKDLDIHVTVSGFVNRIRPHLETWKEIEKEGHIEVINHSYSHLKINDTTNATPADLEKEYVKSKAFFEEHFTTPAFSMVTPNNCTSKEGFDVLSKNYLAVRQGQRGENSLHPEFGKEPGEWLNLKTRGIGDVETTEARNAWVEQTIADRTWLIEMWHNISPLGDSGYQPISTEMAKEHLSYLKKKADEGKIWLAPFTQAISYLYSYANSELETSIYFNRLLRIALAKKDTWNDVHETPISIRVRMKREGGGQEQKLHPLLCSIAAHRKDSRYEEYIINLSPSSSTCNFFVY